jgi:5'-3' exonuclease
MGVPRLAPFIFNKFSHCRYDKNFKKNPAFLRINNLYIDANAILHKSAQKVFNYGDYYSPLENEWTRLSYPERVKRCYEVFIDDLQEIVDLVVPEDMVFISLDGTAPIAKQAQQRQRRFVATKEKLTGGGKIDPTTFSSNCITPGTEFTRNLNEYMKTTKLCSLRVPKGTVVIYDSMFSPGEGEHKILDYIRCRSVVDEKFRENDVHVFFGPDGDLIMLTLEAVNYVRKMTLLRDGRDIGTYDFVDISRVYVDLGDRLSQNNLSRSDAISSFIFAGFFVGNDFLPKIEMFFYLEDGLEMMMKNLEIFSATNRPVVYQGNLTERVVDFVMALKFSEPHYISERQYQQIPVTDDDRFVDYVLLNSVNHHTRELDFDLYRKNYYSSKFGIDVLSKNSAQKIEFISREYWRMVVWVFRYYTQGVESSGWEETYKFHYPPLMCDLAIYLSKNRASLTEVYPTFPYGSPSNENVQLCSVLPPQTAYLIPDENIRKHVSGDLNFKIDYQGKVKDYQGVAHIPFVDISQLRKKIGNDLTPEPLTIFR